MNRHAKQLVLMSLILFLFPVGLMAKGDKDTQTGTIVWIHFKGSTVYGSPDVSSTGVKTQTTTEYSGGNKPPVFVLGPQRAEWSFTVRVGDLLYTGEAIKDERGSEKLSSMLAGQGSLSFKPKDWKDGGEVEVRFEKKGMLVHSIYMYVKKSNGKKAEMRLVSIIGPDGVERCQKLGCANSWPQ